MGKRTGSVYDHPRTGHLIVDKPVVTFAELPVTYQDALIYYMSVDGAAWAVKDGWEDWQWGDGTCPEFRAEVMEDIAKFRQRFVAAYGERRFGIATLPYQTLIDCVNGDEAFENRKYEVNETPNTSEYVIPTWPVILSDFPDETLQDGWHRFDEYCVRKIDVPVTWYAD